MHHNSIDTDDYIKYKTEIVRYHGSDTDSEGMTNKTGSCWMISIMQALRASDIFKKEFKPAKGEKDDLKKELFRLFDIVEGNNGQKKRALKAQEVNDFRDVVRRAGLPAKKSGGYSEVRFLRFLLEHLNAKPIVYYAGTGKQTRKQKEYILTVHLPEKPKSFADLIKDNKIALQDAPSLLPILLKRPRVKKIASTTAIEPSPIIEISNVRYKLVSIVIARTSIHHSYNYVIEDNGWVEYNNHRAILYRSPKTKKRNKDTFTAYEDACRHSEVLFYERCDTRFSI